ncbi:hypothetical protein Fmac_020669 [Flemingia macrophylla]|uniref:BRX domain-containing protein n=1 Tax=Flemingia macrophylla TaxID=520843 RepID=A0ABD1LUT0_9FABA
MLTCIARPKKGESGSASDGDPSLRGQAKAAAASSSSSLTAQIKEMALKASGAYRQCAAPCASRLSRGESESESESRRRWGKEMEARLRGISSGEGTPSSSGRRVVLLLEEDHHPREWVAQVEPGVLITFVSLPPGAGNHLKRIRFRWAPSKVVDSIADSLVHLYAKFRFLVFYLIHREIKASVVSLNILRPMGAGEWVNVMELYNVQRLNRQAVPLPTPPRSEDESSKRESIEEIPVTPPLSRERPPCNLYRAGGGMGMGYSSSDSFDHLSMQSRHYYDPSGVNSTPKASTISAAAKTDISSIDADASIRSSSSREADRSEDLSISNASDLDTEWVEQDEPGVYITIRALPGGKKELRRVRFSREKFGEMHARLWWEENRARIHEQYL